MKRLLFVSHAFPPLLAPESLLTLRTVRALTPMEWEITLLTATEHSHGNAIDHRLSTKVPACIRVVRAASLEPILGATRVLRAMFYAMGLPEIQFSWYWPAVFAGKKTLRDQKFDVIHSWANYHISNVVGLALKRASGLPWVAHFSDPWIDNPYYQFTFMQKKVVRRLEAAVIREADSVVFVTSQTADRVMEKYSSAWRRKVNVIPHGYENIKSFMESSSSESHRLRMVHVGNFYSGKRTPEAMLRGLNLLNRTRTLSNELEVVFCGSNSERYQALATQLGLNEVVNFMGTVPFEIANRHAAEADVLLVIDAPSSTPSLFLPSKLVDYMPFRKPILGLTPLQGASADLLRRLECPVVAPDDVPGIADNVGQMLDLWQSKSLNISPRFDLVSREYDIRQTTKLLDSALCKVIQNHDA